MRKKRLFLWVPLGLLLLLGGVALWLFNTDLGRFSERIESELSTLLGREVRMDGKVSIHLGSEIRVEVTNLSVPNPDWAESEDLVRIGHASARVELSSLWNPPVLVNELIISDVTVGLEVNDEGANTWTFTPPAREKAPDESSPTEGSGGFPVLFRHLDLSRLELSFVKPGRSRPLVFGIEQLVQDQLDSGMLDLTLDGHINDRTVSYQGQLGPFENLISGTNLQFSGAGDFGQLQLSGEGLIDNLTRPHHPELTLQILGQEFNTVLAMLELDAPIHGEYRVNIEIKPKGDLLEVSLEAEVGDLAVSLASQTSGIRDFTVADFRLNAHGDNLGAVTQLVGAGEWPHESFELQSTIRRDGQRLDFDEVNLKIGANTFSLDGSMTHFPHLEDSTLNLNIDGPDVVSFRELLSFKGVATGPFSIRAEIAPGEGTIELVKTSVVTSMGRFTGSGSLTSDPRYVGSSLSVAVEGPDAKALLDGYGITGFKAEPFALEAEFTVGTDHLEFASGTYIEVEGGRVEIDGIMGFKPLGELTSLQVHVTGPDLAHSVGLAGVTLPIHSREYDLTTGFRVTDAGFRLDDLKGTIGGGTVALDGLIPHSGGPKGLDVTFHAAGQNLRQLLKDTDAFEVPESTFDVSGHFRHLGDSLRLENLALSLGDLSASGQLDAPWPQNNDPRGSIQLTAKGPDISQVLPRLADFQPEPSAFTLDLNLEGEDGTWKAHQAELTLGATSFSATGTMDALPVFSSMDLDLSIESPDLSLLGKWKGEALPAVAASLEASVAGNIAAFTIDAFQAALGRSDMSGKLSADLSGPVPDINISVNSRVLDFSELTPAPVQETLAEPDDDGRVIPNTPLPLDALAQWNANLDLVIGEITTHRRRIFDFNLDATLKDGALELRKYQASGIQGEVFGSGSLVPTGDGSADLDFDFHAENIVPNRPDWHDADPDTLPKIDAAAKFSGHGSNYREVAAGLNARVRIVADPGMLPGQGLGALDSYFISQIFSTLLPGLTPDEPTELKCLAISVDVDDGMLVTTPAASLQTSRVLIMTSGEVNLKDETLSFGFETTPTKLLGASFTELVNPFVSIEGTLGAPTPKIDPAGTLVYGGAAAATGGISILAKGLLDRIKSAGDPCGSLRESIRAEQAAKPD